MARMATRAPARKVNFAALGAALSSVGLWVLKDYFGVEPPDEVEVAIVTLVTFVLGYIVPPSPRDVLQANGVPPAAVQPEPDT